MLKSGTFLSSVNFELSSKQTPKDILLVLVFILILILIFINLSTFLNSTDMKNLTKIFLTLLTSAFLMIGCNDDLVEGMGAPITQEFILDDFDSFILDSSIDIVLRQGPRQKVFVTAQPNIIDVINTDVINGEWNISYFESVRAGGAVIEITVPDLRRIVIDGSGDVVGSNYMILDELEIIIDGSGDVELFGEINEQFITIDGSGDIENFDLVSYETTINVDGSGDVEVTAEDVLDVIIDGSGDVKFKGRPDIFLTDNGSGELIDFN